MREKSDFLKEKEKNELSTIANSCDLYSFVRKRKLINDDDFWDEIHLRKIYKNANIKPS